MLQQLPEKDFQEVTFWECVCVTECLLSLPLSPSLVYFIILHCKLIFFTFVLTSGVHIHVFHSSEKRAILPPSPLSPFFPPFFFYKEPRHQDTSLSWFHRLTSVLLAEKCTATPIPIPLCANSLLSLSFQSCRWFLADNTQWCALVWVGLLSSVTCTHILGVYLFNMETSVLQFWEMID